MDVGFAEALRAPGRTAVRALAIGGAVAITLLFEGFRIGLDRQMATPAGSLPASLIALEEGAKHFVGIRSNLPQMSRAAIEAIPGVAATHPLVSVPVIFTHKGRRTPLQLIAYDSGGAPRLAAGRPIRGAHEIVFDQRLARLHRVGVGDHVKLLDRDFAVVGLSTGTDVNFAPLAFLTYDELIDVYLESRVPGAMGGAPLLSYLLIQLKPDADLPLVRRTIESRVSGVDIYTPQELAASDVQLGRQLFGPVLNLLVAVAWVAVVLAVGLTMYAAVIDRRRDFGVMKALGVRTGGLVSTVIVEALLTAALAFPFALVIAKGAGALIETLSPVYRVVPWAPPVILRGAIAAALAGVVGGLVPVRRLAALEPDLVFRS